MASDVLSDLPESADRYEFNVQDGDVIIMATDGIFDNVPDSILVAEIRFLLNLTLVKLNFISNLSQSLIFYEKYKCINLILIE